MGAESRYFRTSSAPTRISSQTHVGAAGPHGWNAQQGFYVYRNRRLLVPGDWLGLNLQKEEHYKLTCFQVDLPNDLDSEWQIDVKKHPAARQVVRSVREQHSSRGLVRCGRCGRKMQVAYSAVGSRVGRYACHQAHRLHGTDHAWQSLGGIRLDERVAEAVLSALIVS